MSNSKGSILISNANAVGTALVNKLGGTGYTPNEWADETNLLGIADADIPTALAGITEGSYAGEDRGAIKICNANNMGAILNKKFNTNRGFKPTEWESAISKLTALTTGTVSGSVVSISDGADDVPVVNCIASVVPVQDLHGYSKPWPAGGGKNLFDKDYLSNIASYKNLANGYYYTDKIVLAPNTQYTISPTSTASLGVSDYYVLYINPDASDPDYLVITNPSIKYPVSGGTPATVTFTTGATGVVRLGITSYAGAPKQSDLDAFMSINYQLELGASATSFEPYSNICPISGSTETTVYQFGKNLVDGTNFTQGLPSTSIGASIDTISTSTRYAYFGTPIKGGNYNISSVSNDSDYYNAILIFGYSGGFLTVYTSGTVNGNKTVDFSGCDYIRIAIGTRTVSYIVPTDFTDYGTIQMEYGSTATTYESYKSKTPITVTFGQTVYGADVDAVSGNDNITYASVTYNGSEDWTAYASGNGYARSVTDMASGTYYNDSMVKCDVFAKQPDNTNLGVRIGVGNSNIYVVQANTLEGISDVTSFKTWLSNNPITITFPLDTITPFTTDPNTISTYKNNNTFYNTTGDTYVTYYKGV